MKVGRKIAEFYFGNYKKLLIIPFAILAISLFLLTMQIQTKGDIINRDISLKGGITLTVLDSTQINIDELQSDLTQKLASYETSIRTLKAAGSQIGILIESDIPELSQNDLNTILSSISAQTNKQYTQDDYSLESLGSSLGDSIFNQIMRALLVAFIFMAIVVYLYFRALIPSLAVILAAFSDIVGTVAIVNLLGIKIGSAGIAALLMLIGYSIDTDIMLTTKVLKRRGLELHEAIASAFKTGMTMTVTTLIAVSVALIFTQSETIRQIMTILFIGLILDMIYTWIQNSSLLLWHVETKK